MDSPHRRPRLLVVVLLAAVGGVIGLAAGLVVGGRTQGGVQGDPDSIARMIVENTWALSWALLGGGAGWLVGASLGWRLDRPAGPRDTGRAWGLWLLAVPFVLVASAVVRTIATGDQAWRTDVDLGYDPLVIARLVVLDALLAIATLLLLSWRSASARRVSSVVGVALVTVAAVQLVMLPAPNEQWLRRWLTERQAPLGAARNLTAEAPARCAGTTPGMSDHDRSFSTEIPFVRYWINPFAPRWLPDGFGLDMARSWPWPRPHGVWTDERCREVALVLMAPRKGRDLPPATGDVGAWSEVAPTWCPIEQDSCREVRVLATFCGSDSRQLLVLRTVGLAPDEVERIATTIPTDRVVHI